MLSRSTAGRALVSSAAAMALFVVALAVPPAGAAALPAGVAEGSTRPALPGATSPEPNLPNISLSKGLVLPEGDALKPDAGAAARLQALRRAGQGARAAVPPTVTDYNLADAPSLDVAPEWRPYRLPTPAALGEKPRDSKNVKMALIGGQLYDHPVAQAQDGLFSLDSYRLTGDKAYFEQALADANRLVDTRVESRGAWFYPYQFDFALHGDKTDVIRAPWFSAMAQGQALSLFVRMHEVTGDDLWRTAAENTLASLGLGPVATDPTIPWVSWVDGSKNLWLEEYAQQPVSRADRTINGHVFAMFGLWDAWKLLRDQNAYILFRGGAATAGNTFAGYRVPSWASKYCLTHGTLDPGYHNIVFEELVQLHALTTFPSWSQRADILAADYPRTKPAGNVALSGSVTGYTFSPTGAITGQRTISLSRASSAPSDARMRIRNRGIHYRITAGTLAGYWVSESYPDRRLIGIYERVTYPRERRAYFPPKTASGYKVSDPGGATSSPVTATFSAESSAPFDKLAWVSGRPYVHITKGVFADRWVPSGGLRLA